jgi:hypothetical protein
MNFSVTQNGKPLNPKLYNWDEDTKTFSTNESDLVLDFSKCEGITFNTGYNCTFKTGSDCTFKTGSFCTFKTNSHCTFTTGSYCTFTTGSHCTFDTSSDCTFTTGYNCTFDTGSDCTFKTGSNCVIVRRDVFEVIQPKTNQTIRLNDHLVKGYSILEDKKN